MGIVELLLLIYVKSELNSIENIPDIMESFIS